jgi:hypothetical protein
LIGRSHQQLGAKLLTPSALAAGAAGAAVCLCCWQVLGAKVKLMALQEALLGLEVDAVEVVAGLVTEFDGCYSEMAEANKLQYNAYFTQVRSSGCAAPQSCTYKCDAQHESCSAALLASLTCIATSQTTSFGMQVRDLQNNFFAGLVSAAPSYRERYGSAADNPELEALPEEVALLLGDKDALGNALQVGALQRRCRLTG